MKVYAIPNAPTPGRPAIFNPEICNGCNVCVENCPAGALSPQGNDKSKCVIRYGEYGLSGLLRHVNHILKEEDPAKRKELIFGPTTWGLWMQLQYGGGPSKCNSCIALCPVGWKGPRPPISFKPEFSK